jgi:flagellar FliL protein
MNDKTNDSATKAGGVAKKLATVGGALLLLVAGGIAGPFVRDALSPAAAGDPDAAEAEEETAPDAPALYTSLHPPLVVNLKDASGESHYMQVTMEVMSRDPHAIDAVKKHAPAIRNSLILLYGSNVDFDAVNTREGKEQMLSDALAEIQKIMRQRIGIDGVEAVYFTSLIIQ